MVSEFSVSPESVEVSNGLPESPMVSHCSFASIYYVRMCEQSDHVYIQCIAFPSVGKTVGRMASKVVQKYFSELPDVFISE